MLVIGLTGNIGCGKSSLSKLLIKQNIDVIDADLISREIMYDKELLKIVFNNFGSEIKNNDGTLNRKKLGDIVFNDDEKLIELNNITHPAIKRKINNNIKDLYKKGKNIVVIDAALLIEGKFLDLVNKLLVIVCNEEIQLNRVMKRDNLTEEEALKRINSQMKQDEKVKYADYIIDNSKDMDNLRIEFNKFSTYIKENWLE